MPKRAAVLTDKQVRALRRIGLHAVGGPVPGLALQVTQTEGNDFARSWVLRALVAGKRRAFGLGPYPAVTLAEARGRAEHMHRDIREHRNPALRQRSPSADVVQSSPPTMTFEAAALQYIEERRPSWKNAKHAAQWESTLRTYAFPLMGGLAVADVDKVMVLRIIKPIWNEKTETANRVRDRIKLVLGWAKAHGLREGDNPAEWRGNLEHALAAPEKVSRTLHQPALPVSEIGGFMCRLRHEQKDLAARALEFAILTAARDGEVRAARWSEIDLDAGIWSIPAERMKAGKLHRVPLSPAALSLLGHPTCVGADFKLTHAADLSVTRGWVPAL